MVKLHLAIGTDHESIDLAVLVGDNFFGGEIDFRGGDESGKAEATQEGGGHEGLAWRAGVDGIATADAVLVNGGDPNGAAYVPEVDFNGLAREGDKPDVGAYEWYGDGNPGWPIQEGFKETLTNTPGRGEEIDGGCCKDKSDSSESLLLFPLAFLAWKRRKS